MLFKVNTLNKIKSGEVTLAFRKWKRPTVKKNGTLITRAGQLRITDIQPVTMEDIALEELKFAGIENKKELARMIQKQKDGQLYKITFTLIGPDPRLELRNKILITDEEMEVILQKLSRMDKNKIHGPWTFKVLKAIANRPRMRAIDLAKELGVEKDWLKPSIRKLKSLGLTISHEVGYELSPRGKVVLAKLEG